MLMYCLKFFLFSLYTKQQEGNVSYNAKLGTVFTLWLFTTPCISVVLLTLAALLDISSVYLKVSGPIIAISIFVIIYWLLYRTDSLDRLQLEYEKDKNNTPGKRLLALLAAVFIMLLCFGLFAISMALRHPR
ncbi:MAG: hypothetical protein EOP48_29280 [Sphingobacteriales bacterium]|nr:MAG: hypothetical protein EOP48_29280 [Sphingobacteriales bacterium]